MSFGIAKTIPAPRGIERVDLLAAQFCRSAVFAAGQAVHAGDGGGAGRAPGGTHAVPGALSLCRLVAGKRLAGPSAARVYGQNFQSTLMPFLRKGSANP